MKKYEFISHTADVRILASGSTPEELFSAALEALCEVLLHDNIDLEKLPAPELILEITSVDMTALLIDFLSAALTAMHSGKALYPLAEFEKLDENHLSAHLHGFMVSGFAEDIKAVTYHEAEIREAKGMLQTIIVLDV